MGFLSDIRHKQSQNSMVTQPLFCPSCVFSKPQHLLVFLSFLFYNCAVEDASYLDPLQSGGGLGYILRHVEAFGGADFGVDQPLLEVSECGAEPLLQQALLVLALPRRPEAEAGGERRKGDGWRRIRRALCHTVFPLTKQT